ncbi:MAG: hypothetical protein WKF43_10530 [Acidimicrobiales bacterium]
MLADQATAEEHAARPTARALSEAIKTAIPEATLPAPAPDAEPAPPQPAPDEPAEPEVPDPASPSVLVPSMPPPPLSQAEDPLPERVRRAIPALAAVVGIALVLVGFQQVVAHRRTPAPVGRDEISRAAPLPSSPTSARSADSSSTTTTTVASTTTRSAGAPSPDLEPPTSAPPKPEPAPATTDPLKPARPACAPAPPPAADVDGDGCPESYRISGPQLTAAGVTYQVGRLGDLLSVGDWDCDGTATPAVLRRATGEVFVFPRWAGELEDVTVPATSTVPGGTGLRTGSADDDGCVELIVERGAAHAETIRMGRGA